MAYQRGYLLKRSGGEAGAFSKRISRGRRLRWRPFSFEGYFCGVGFVGAIFLVEQPIGFDVFTRSAKRRNKCSEFKV